MTVIEAVHVFCTHVYEETGVCPSSITLPRAAWDAAVRASGFDDVGSEMIVDTGFGEVRLLRSVWKDPFK